MLGTSGQESIRYISDTAQKYLICMSRSVIMDLSDLQGRYGWAIDACNLNLTTDLQGTCVYEQTRPNLPCRNLIMVRACTEREMHTAHESRVEKWIGPWASS